jgi:hypothetical protein
MRFLMVLFCEEESWVVVGVECCRSADGGNLFGGWVRKGRITTTQKQGKAYSRSIHTFIDVSYK